MIVTGSDICPTLKYGFKPHKYAFAVYSNISWRQPQLHPKTLALITVLECNTTRYTTCERTQTNKLINSRAARCEKSILKLYELYKIY